jgi:short-subunit dehydrogenase
MARRGEGQTVLVTGASAGIGVELAECFAKDGYDVIVTARSEGPLKELAGRLARQHNVQAVAIAADIGQPGSGAKLASEIKSRGLNVDVLVNNAGYGMSGGFDDLSAESQLGMIDLNVRALVELTHMFFPDMLKKNRGGVLNVASTAAFQPGPFMTVYYATKAFVLSFSEALSEEARGTGVKVTALCPGPTESKFHDRAGTTKVRASKIAGMMTSKAVAEIGYNAFQSGRRVAISGRMNAVMARMVPFFPRGMTLGLVRSLNTRYSDRA